MVEIIPNWHPLFVHFTVALLSVSIGLLVVGYFVSNEQWQKQILTVAYWNLWLGVLITLVTVSAGWIAFNSVEHDDPAHEVMVEHRNLAFTTLGAFLVLGVWAAARYRRIVKPQVLFVILMVAAGGLLATTAWHGAELVYRHGLGVMSLPDTGGHDHADGGHGHDESAANSGAAGMAGGDTDHHQEEMADDHHDQDGGRPDGAEDDHHSHDNGDDHAH